MPLVLAGSQSISRPLSVGMVRKAWIPVQELKAGFYGYYKISAEWMEIAKEIRWGDELTCHLRFHGIEIRLRPYGDWRCIIAWFSSWTGYFRNIYSTSSIWAISSQAPAFPLTGFCPLNLLYTGKPHPTSLDASDHTMAPATGAVRSSSEKHKFHRLGSNGLRNGIQPFL